MIDINKILENLETLVNFIDKYINDKKKTPALTLALSGLFYFLFNPQSGQAIKQILGPALEVESTFTFYARIFWSTLLLIILIFIIQLFWKRDSPPLNKTISIDSKKIKKNYVIIIFLISSIVISSFFIGYSQKIKYGLSDLECELSGDCFSFGEDPLIFQTLSEDLNVSYTDEKKLKEIKSCNDSSRSKYIATQLFGINRDQSYNRFQAYLKECPTDGEAQIYSTNSDISLKHENSIIKIATSVPISREQGSIVSQEILRGVALAQKEFNDNNNKLKIMVGIADDGFISADYTNKETSAEREGSKKVANFLISKLDDVVAVIGHLSSDATEAASEFYENKIVLISPTSTATRNNLDKLNSKENDEGNLNLGRYTFRTVVDDEIFSKKIVEEINKDYQKHLKDNQTYLNEPNDILRITIIWDKSSKYSSGFKDNFEKHIKDNLESPEFNECEISNELRFDHVKCLNTAQEGNGKYNILLLVPGSKDVEEQFIYNLIELNYNRNKQGIHKSLPVYASDSMYQDRYKSSIAEGMKIHIPWQFNEKHPGQIEKQAQDLFHIVDGFTWRSAMAYDATNAITTGISSAEKLCRPFRIPPKYIPNPFTSHQKSNCLRKELYKAMIQPEFTSHGINGKSTLMFDKNHDRKIDNSFGTTVKVSCENESKCEWRSLS